MLIRCTAIKGATCAFQPVTATDRTAVAAPTAMKVAFDLSKVLLLGMKSTNLWSLSFGTPFCPTSVNSCNRDSSRAYTSNEPRIVDLVFQAPDRSMCKQPSCTTQVSRKVPHRSASSTCPAWETPIFVPHPRQSMTHMFLSGLL